MFPVIILISALAARSSASTLYVSSYTGAITTLNLANINNTTYKLTQVAQDTHSSPNASWLQLDRKHGNLFALDENIIGLNGSINSYKVDDATGLLSPVARHDTLAAPVNSAIYTSPNGSQLLAVAHYSHALTTWHVNPTSGDFSPFDNFNFTLPKPGPVAERQAASHPHQALIDPTKTYLIVPDLGADLIRVFHIDTETLRIHECPSIPAPAGSGPRHGRFFEQSANETLYYLITEISNQLLTYHVSYLPHNGGLAMRMLGNDTPTYGAASNATMFTGNAAAEIVLHPHSKSLYVSNRNASVIYIPNPSGENATQIKSDAIAHFTIGGDGKPKFGELSPAGGSYPRHFALSPDGKMAAVPSQLSGRVAVFSVCAETGKMGTEVLADVEGLGNVTSVVWAY